MIETPAQRQLALKHAGEALTFAAGEVLALPGFSVTKFYHGETSTSELRIQKFTFQVDAQDVVDFGIGVGQTFTMTDDVFVYSFIVRNLMPDISGWFLLEVDYDSRSVA